MSSVAAGFHAADVAVVIPTRDRWPILDRTLDGLRRQTVGGFETVVVVDGTDQAVPDLGPVTVVVKEQGGPGAARNAGARATDRPIILFLGDDMLPAPDLVARHVQRHNANLDETVAVLGHVDWHKEVAANQIARWLDWSGTQFDYRWISGEDAGFGRFYSCNVSLKRRFFQSAGGFDESFTYYYEDLDCGYRLGQKGMQLHYEPMARTFHLHRYDWNGLERRFRGVAIGEHHMAGAPPVVLPLLPGPGTRGCQWVTAEPRVAGSRRPGPPLDGRGARRRRAPGRPVLLRPAGHTLPDRVGRRRRPGRTAGVPG